MGFGIDRSIHAARLWMFPVLYYIERKDNKVVFSDQMISGDTLVGRNPSPSKTMHNTLQLKQLKNGTGYDTLVHELGHLLGLAHEHDRNDDAGNKYRATLAIDFKEEVAKNAIEKKKYVKYGVFDAQSIMCYGTTNTTGPSDGDKATLKAIYGWS